MPALAVRFLESGTNVPSIGNRLAADIENDVAGPEAVLGGLAVRVDTCHDDAILPSPLNFAGRSDAQAQLQRALIRLAGVVSAPRWPRVSPATCPA